MPPTDASPFPLGLAEAAAAAGVHLEALAGRGGSGAVYFGRTETGTAVAVKLLDVATDVGRIRREADALSKLSHDGIPTMIDVIDAAGRSALVTTWVDGTALADVLHTGPIAPQRARAVFASLADVLDHVHAADIVHRDLSPDNIIVRADDSVAVIDFGISRSADSATLTAEGITAGTPRYLAPETLRGDEPTAAADQYSAGILLSEMLTGTWPYPDAGDTIASTMHHHLHSAPVPVSETNTWLGTTFDAAIDRALAKNPTDRFASLHDMIKAIDESAGSSAASSWASKRGLAALLVLLVAAVVGTLLFQLDSPDGAATPWPAGTASDLACNLLLEPDFESGTVPIGFFDAVADRNDVAPAGGVDGTAAVRIGVGGGFGLYGETVPIVPGEGYVFRAFVAPTADVQEAILRMVTLDENFELIASVTDPELGADEVEVLLDPGTAQHVTLTMPSASAAARFLVPSLVKEGPDGYLLADELVLAPLGSDCADEVVG